MRRLVAGLALALALAPAAQADERLRSGPLEVSVQAEPFALEFVDTTDGDVLRTFDGGAARPDDPAARYGPLGYSFDLRIPVLNNAILGYYAALESETVWFHATRVTATRTQGEALVLDLATNDPLGHTLELTLAPAGEGGITASSRIASGPFGDLASVSGASFAAAGEERYLGFGSRSNAVDQTGGSVFSWAEEGPFSSAEAEDELRPLLPEFTFPTGPTATNFPIPWLVSTRGFGLLVDQTERSTFFLKREREDAWRAEAESNRFRFSVFAGPNPAQVVRRYSRYAGRQPEAEPWFFGPWFQPTLEKEPYELAESFRFLDVPVTVAQTYTHYLPCGAHVGRDQQERERIERYHRLGFKITTYFNPHVCTTYQPVYDEAAAAGLFVKNAAGEPYLLTNPFTADEQISEIDFTNPAGRALYQRLLDDAIDAGYDGWMEDFGEYTPFDARFANGETGKTMHNRYPVRVPRRLDRAHDPARRRLRSLHPFRLPWRAAVRAGRLGRRPERGLELLGRVVRGAAPAAQRRPVRNCLPGLRHRRLPFDRRAAHDRRAERPLASARRDQRRDADAGERLLVRRRPRRALAGVEPEGAPRLAPLREAAHAALPLHRLGIGRVPAHGHADRTPAVARLPR